MVGAEPVEHGGGDFGAGGFVEDLVAGVRVGDDGEVGQMVPAPRHPHLTHTRFTY